MSDSESAPSNQHAVTTTAPTSLSQQLFELAQSRRAQASELRALAKGPSVEADALEAGAVKMEDVVLDIARQSEIKRESVLHDKWLKEQENYLAWHRENSTSVISLSQSAVRMAATVNAGAAVALLAFLGNALAKNEHIVAEQFAGSLLTFGIGVVVAALTGGFSYFTQFLYGVDEPTKQTYARRLHVFTVFLWFASTGTFAYGCFETYNAVRSVIHSRGDVMNPENVSGDTSQEGRRNAPPPVRPASEPPVVERPIQPPPDPKPPANP